MSRRRRRIELAIGFGLLIALASLPLPPGAVAGSDSLRIVSREGTLLRSFADTSRAQSRSVALSQFPEHLRRAVLVAEDKRFYQHPGFDPLAMLRAAYTSLLRLRIVSGASTITQQLVRMNHGAALPKIFEILLAIKVEWQFSKDEILEMYLNSLPMKFNRRGIPAAAAALFKRDVQMITPPEAVALAVLIRENYATVERFSWRAQRLWRRLYTGKQLSTSGLVAGVYPKERPRQSVRERGTRHFQDWLRQSYPKAAGTVRTTISAELNQKITRIVNKELRILEGAGARHGAVLVFERGSEHLELLAMVGSRDHDDPEGGQVNGAFSQRPAGSTMKPLLYAQAFDELDWAPHTMIEDRRQGIHLGDRQVYIPRNNDLRYWGRMTVREALANSRNLPAVATLAKLGVKKFYELLLKAGYRHLNKSASYYGVGLALGAGETTLWQLARAYGALANGGYQQSVVLGDQGTTRLVIGGSRRLFKTESAVLVTHVLSDKAMRRRAFGVRNFLDFPFDVAAKTGTSKDYRDSWTVGYTNDHIIAVWVGDFRGKQMQQVSGGWGAARIFQQVTRLVTGERKPRFRYPDNWRKARLCRRSGQQPMKNCPTYEELLSPKQNLEDCSGKHEQPQHETEPVVLSPTSGESFLIDPTVPLAHQKIPLKIAAPHSSERFSYQLNDRPRVRIASRINEMLEPRRGNHEVHIYHDDEILYTVHYRVR